jgi:hypothetical protein
VTEVRETVTEIEATATATETVNANETRVIATTALRRGASLRDTTEIVMTAVAAAVAVRHAEAAAVARPAGGTMTFNYSKYIHTFDFFRSKLLSCGEIHQQTQASEFVNVRSGERGAHSSLLARGAVQRHHSVRGD